MVETRRSTSSKRPRQSTAMPSTPSTPSASPSKRSKTNSQDTRPVEPASVPSSSHDAPKEADSDMIPAELVGSGIIPAEQVDSEIPAEAEVGPSNNFPEHSSSQSLPERSSPAEGEEQAPPLLEIPLSKRKSSKSSTKPPWGKLLSECSQHPHRVLRGSVFTIGNNWKCHLQLGNLGSSSIVFHFVFPQFSAAAMAVRSLFTTSKSRSIDLSSITRSPSLLRIRHLMTLSEKLLMPTRGSTGSTKNDRMGCSCESCSAEMFLNGIFSSHLGSKLGDSNISYGHLPNKCNVSTLKRSMDFGLNKPSSASLFGRNTISPLSRLRTKCQDSWMIANNMFPSMRIPSQRCFSSNSDLPPHQVIGMPSLSPTMTEGNIARWLKKEGDQVSTGEVLCEVETDKATVEMECMEDGYLAKIVQVDGAKEIKVGEVIAITVEEEGDIDKFTDFKVLAAPEEVAAPSASEPSPPKEDSEPQIVSKEPSISKHVESHKREDRIFSSPLARKLAEDHNVSLSSIKGTGPEGRIVKADVEDYLASGANVGAPKIDVRASQGADYSDVPISQIRKITASRLLLSKQTIPHYYLSVDACVDKLMDLRVLLNSLQEASGGKRISINDLVIKAAALALRKVPECNSSWMNDVIRQYHSVNINVAVQTEHGLFVPVIKDADKKGLSRISEEVKTLAQKAKENSLKPEDYEGGTFTVSNLGGPFGVKQFCAIVNPPQSGILAVGSAERRVVPGTGNSEFEFGSFMSATLSCDHRVIDGAIGAEWLKAFKGYLENPQSMLL